MATDAIVILEKLRCISLNNTEKRTEPYIWPALIRVDDTTIAKNKRVDIVVPRLADARVVIKDSMRAGETADIPGSVGTLYVRFEDNLTVRRLILVVALLEMDETPRSAMEAGFKAFTNELRDAIGEELYNLNGADDEEETRIIGDIEKRVANRVRTAVRNGLSSWEKAKVFAGKLNPDDPMGSAFKQFGENSLVPAPITLALEATTSFLDAAIGSSKYEIQGQLQVRPVVIERCRPQVNAVNAAQAVVNGIEEEISNLEAQLSGGGDGPALSKEYILNEMERIRDQELGPAVVALEDARAALQFCRDPPRVAVDPRGGIGVSLA